MPSQRDLPLLSSLQTEALETELSPPICFIMYMSNGLQTGSRLGCTASQHLLSADVILSPG